MRDWSRDTLLRHAEGRDEDLVSGHIAASHRLREQVIRFWSRDTKLRHAEGR